MEDKKVFLSIGENYFAGEDGTLYAREPIIKDGEAIGVSETAIANHTPVLKEQQTIDNGVETIEQLLFDVRRGGRMWGSVPVTKKDILSQTPHIKFGAACRIFLGRGYKGMYGEAMQIQCETAPCRTVYQRTGYGDINGERVFLNGKHSVTKSGLTEDYDVEFPGQLINYGFTDEREQERFNTLLHTLPSVAPQNLIYAGLGLSFLSPLNSMLRDAGIEPSFILYFTGKTGTRKTTMAKLFLNFFGSFSNGTSPPAGFRDTTNAVEKKFALLDSTLVLLDDRIPSTTPKIKTQMEAMEQSVARQIGDRSGRSRMNADGTLKVSYIPKCNLIITAEESFNNVGESAIARSISVELKPGDINLAELTKAQQNAKHLNECMGDYIQWLLQNWDSVAEFVTSLFLPLRDKAQSGGHGRLAECVAHLQIGIICMCNWLKSIDQLSEDGANAIQAKSWNIYMKLADEQNRRITEEKPTNLFLDAIREMLNTKVIRVTDVNNGGVGAGQSNHVGYRDKEFYYFVPGAIYSAVRKYYQEMDKTFPLGQKAIFQHLADERLIVSYQSPKSGITENTKAKRIKNLQRMKYLWLKADALDKETDE